MARNAAWEQSSYGGTITRSTPSPQRRSSEATRRSACAIAAAARASLSRRPSSWGAWSLPCISSDSALGFSASTETARRLTSQPSSGTVAKPTW